MTLGQAETRTNHEQKERKTVDKRALIADLKERIAGGEPGNAGLPGAISLGTGIDEALPDGGLRKGALHEIAASAYRDMGAATGFLAALAVCAMKDSSRPVLWCEAWRPPFDMGRLHGPGIAAFGLDPARLLLAAPPGDSDCLWVMEEALRSRAFAFVAGEVDGRSSALSLAATRRLQLAAEETQTPVLLFTGHAKGSASVAVTRWHVAGAESRNILYADEMERLPGCPRWDISLARCRGGQPGRWRVEWNAQERVLSRVSPVKEGETKPAPAKARAAGDDIVFLRQTA
ncbi:ImuA family protein [Parvibaculum sp.]|uniref:ImuA family protein n=1 Tax=Parvibaculum sp. TaxID=2024848 RepID=UPI002FD9120E